MPRAKTELVIIHTDKDGKKTQYKVKSLPNESNKKDQVDWVKQAIKQQEWEDDQPGAGMASGCW